MNDAIEIFVHDDWARACSKTTPRAAQASTSGVVSLAKP